MTASAVIQNRKNLSFSVMQLGSPDRMGHLDKKNPLFDTARGCVPGNCGSDRKIPPAERFGLVKPF